MIVEDQLIKARIDYILFIFQIIFVYEFLMFLYLFFHKLTIKDCKINIVRSRIEGGVPNKGNL